MFKNEHNMTVLHFESKFGEFQIYRSCTFKNTKSDHVHRKGKVHVDGKLTAC